jgi:hypothetical protein
MAVHEATLLLGEKVTVLFGLWPLNVSGLRRRLRKKLGNGTRRTRVLMSNSWFERKDGEENAGTPDILAFFGKSSCFNGG